MFWPECSARCVLTIEEGFFLTLEMFADPGTLILLRVYKRQDLDIGCLFLVNSISCSFRTYLL